MKLERLSSSTSKAFRKPFPLFGLAFLACATLFSALNLASATPAAAQETDRIHWAQLTGGQVKLSDKTPIHWNIYEPVKSEKREKKDKKNSNLVLLLLGRRYMMIDVKGRAVYSVTPQDLTVQGSDFESADLSDKSRLIPSSDWTDRDVGPAELVRFTLGDYGGVLEISLPHMPDLRPFY